MQRATRVGRREHLTWAGMDSGIIDLINFERDREDDARIVKSALRSMRLLEVLHSSRAGVRLKDLARLIKAPVSSTEYILKTMLQTGHLSYDSDTKTYRLNERIGLLGNWINPLLVTDGPIVRCMKEMRDATNRNVILVTRNGALSQAIHIELARHMDAVFVVGRAGHLLHSPAGMGLLSLMDDSDIAGVVRSYNALEGALEGSKKLADVMETVGAIRKAGYVFDRSPEGWALVIPLRELEGQVMAVVIGSMSADETVDISALLALWRKSLAQLTPAPEAAGKA